MELLLDENQMKKLKESHVAVFGIGGVGGYVAESLARCAVGELTLIDKDVIDITNINRQIIALNSTIGEPKVEIMKNRILDINKNAVVHTFKKFFNDATLNDFDFSKFSYIVDAIDTVSSKLLLIEKAKDFGVKIISSMGTGNKINPAMLEVADIYETSNCPLARVMRQELRKRSVKHLKVVYSKESPIKQKVLDSSSKKISPGSFSFVPPVAGFIIASEIIKDLILELNKIT